MPIPASTITEVIEALDTIIAQCLSENNKLGLFAALYRKVTIQVKEGIATQRFENGERMERLDVAFANRYLEAYQAYLDGTPLTVSWRTTFEAAKNPGLFMIQHLFAGMNAHISLDLGIATAQTAQGQPLSAIADDFNEINNLLAEMIKGVEKALEKTSVALMALDFLAGNKDEKLAQFSLELFRKRAWDISTQLYELDSENLELQIAALDHQVSRENHWFTDLGSRLLPAVVQLAALVENKKAGAVIQAFNAL